MAALTRSLACVRSSHLVPTGAMERLASLNVEDYVYPTPTPQQAHMLQQQAALLSAPQLPLQQRGPSMPAEPNAASATVPFCQLQLSASVVPAAGLAAGKVGGAQAACVDLLDSMLPLDLDDDCLRLMFGEEEADGDQGAADSESPKSGGSAVSAAQGGEQRLTRSASAAKGVPAEQSSSADEEDDAVDLLFQDLSSLGHVASYGDLDLDVLQALQQDFDAEGADSAKRARREPNLMLSMNYASAAQTINSIMGTAAGGHKAGAGFASVGMDAPGSPDSLASAATMELERYNSTGKRKRAV